MLDPYHCLGVDRGADPSQIARAYRQKAKGAHPDGGGSPEAFEALARSKSLLLDPKRREKFDRTGQWDEAKPDNAISGAMSVVMKFMNQVAVDYIQGRGRDPVSTDLVSVARLTIRGELNRLLTTRKMLDGHIGTLEKMGARLARKSGPAHICDGLKWQIAQLREQAKPLDEDILHHQDAISMLEEYTFTPDTLPEVRCLDLHTRAFFT